MKLKEQPVLLIDCQTTGMRPSAGQMLELAWCVSNPEDPNPTIESRLIRLPEGESVPKLATELTGITDADMEAAVSMEEVFASFQKTLSQLHNPALSVIHYAQFEKAFLKDFFQRYGIGEIPLEIFCSHSLTKRLFPNLPSQNIRGTAGYFGDPVAQIKRSAAHVRATHQIWKGLVNKLNSDGVETFDQLREFLKNKTKVQKGRYEYRLESAQRLKLPDAPGVYRMLAKTGEVLYVGKATSLKSRVNSYFRGQANRDKRKLEMLAQVWDLNVTECPSPMEAALLEADEIKKFNPPYNVVMKKGKRHLVFYSRDFASVKRSQDHKHPIGPFRNHNWIEHLRMLERSLKTGVFEQIFFNYIPPEQMKTAFTMFLEQQNLQPEKLTTVRQMLAFGVKLHREYEEPLEDEVDEEEVEAEVDALGNVIYTDEEVLGKFERLFRRAGAEKARSRRLTSMLNAKVTYHHAGEARTLEFKNGFRESGADQKGEFPWSDHDIETFDRMSVLLSELSKYEHQIESR